jgi:glucose-1-phosphate thymidylyltransferase
VKGIILAGGKGTRLYPATFGTCKQLLPVYDKPMIYYSMSVLMLAGIKDILIISTPHDHATFQRIFNDGSQLGISVSYAVQAEPRGLAEAFIVGKSFVNDQPVTLILGDNIFFGSGFKHLLRSAVETNEGCTVFGCTVNNPKAYGVASLDEDGRITRIIEKPTNPMSDIAITGLYIYDKSVCERARELEPSHRGELEITDLNNSYLKDGMLSLEVLPRGFTWFDTGTHDLLLEASEFVKAIENRQGLKIGCIEEIAYRNGWIDRDRLSACAQAMAQNHYGAYLRKLLV